MFSKKAEASNFCNDTIILLIIKPLQFIELSINFNKFNLLRLLNNIIYKISYRVVAEDLINFIIKYNLIRSDHPHTSKEK